MKSLLVCAFAMMTYHTSAHAGDDTCPISLPKAKLCAVLHWDVEPARGREAKATLSFWNPEIATAAGPYSTPVDPIQIELWMPMGDHGHGSSPTRLKLREPGIFAVTRMFFVMRGTWQVRVQRLDPEEKVIEQDAVEAIVP